MPRQYGKHEIQRVIDETHRLAQLDRAEPPKVDDVLAAIGIEHDMNIPWVAGEPRSWHKKPTGDR